MENIIVFFYRYRFKLALILGIFSLDYAFSTVVLTTVEYWLRPEPAPFVRYTKKSVTTAAVMPLESYKSKIIGSSLFPSINNSSGTDSDNPLLAANIPNVEFEKLGLVLTGTVTGPKWFSRAYIRSSKAKEKKDKFGRAYKIGQNVLGGKLLWVWRRRVLIRYNGAKEILYLYPPKKDPKGKKGGASSYASAQTFNQTMTRGELNKKIFGNLNNVMKGLAVGPNFKGSKMEGYKLKRVRRSNVLYNMGARSGDVVMAVNGHKIDDIKKVLKIWERIKTEKNIKVDLKRGGKIVTYNFNIKD